MFWRKKNINSGKTIAINWTIPSKMIDAEDNTTLSATTSITTISRDPGNVDNAVEDSSVAATSTEGSSVSVLEGNDLIQGKVDLGSWKSDGKTRYLLTRLIHSKSGRMDESITVDSHCSDQVVWNIAYITEKTKPFPVHSPTMNQRLRASTWLISFRSQLNAVLLNEVQNLYFVQSNSEQWSILRKDGNNFTSYADLLKKTNKANTENVSIFDNVFNN